MGIAQDILRQNLLMEAHLRIGIQPSAGVIEIDLTSAIKAGIVTVTQFVQIVGFIVGRVFQDEISIFGHSSSLSAVLLISKAEGIINGSVSSRVLA